MINKIIKIIINVLKIILGIFCFLMSITSLILSFTNGNGEFAIYFTMFIFFGIVSILCFKPKKTRLKNSQIQKNTQVNDLKNSCNSLEATQGTIETNDTYIETGNTIQQIDNEPISDKNIEKVDAYIETVNTIQRVDNKPITDEEIPYLMQFGYEKALQKTGRSNGEILDTSFINQDIAEKKKATIIPSYQEIIRFPKKCESTIFSTDIYFLKYINGLSVENAHIAQYWYYEYGLNYTNEIKKLYASDLLEISNINIQKLKVDDLKNILRHFNLPLSGKKADLINRILNNISSEDLSSFLGDSTHYFCATDKGISLIEGINDSATFNLELENEALSLILNHDYENAFNLIWDYKKQTPAEKNIHYEYNCSYMDEAYNSIMTPCGFFYTLVKDRTIEYEIRAAIVFCRMYGLGQDKVLKLIMRIYKETGHNFSEDAKNLLNGKLL